MILAYVRDVAKFSKAVTYALWYLEAVAIADTMGWTKTPSWEKGSYVTSAPPKRLLVLLEPHRMSEGRWWQLIVGSPPSDL